MDYPACLSRKIHVHGPSEVPAMCFSPCLSTKRVPNRSWERFVPKGARDGWTFFPTVKGKNTICKPALLPCDGRCPLEGKVDCKPLFCPLTMDFLSQGEVRRSQANRGTGLFPSRWTFFSRGKSLAIPPGVHPGITNKHFSSTSRKETSNSSLPEAVLHPGSGILQSSS